MGAAGLNLLPTTVLLWCSSICSSQNVCTCVVVVITPSELFSPAGAQIYKIKIIELPFSWRIETSFWLLR